MPRTCSMQGWTACAAVCVVSRQHAATLLPVPASTALSAPRASAQVDVERVLGRLRNAAAEPAPGLPEWALQAAQNRHVACTPALHALPADYYLHRLTLPKASVACIAASDATRL